MQTVDVLTNVATAVRLHLRPSRSDARKRIDSQKSEQPGIFGVLTNAATMPALVSSP